MQGSSTESRSVAIIGGGPNGIHMARWARICGLKPTIFEREGSENPNASPIEREKRALEAVGGVWRGNRDGACRFPGGAWPGMYALSTRFTENFFHGFPVPPSTKSRRERNFPDDTYLSYEEICEYIYKVVKALGLLEIVKFGHEVVGASQLPDNTWKLTIRVYIEGQDPVIKTEHFDCLVVAAGALSTPYIPDFKNRSVFTGRFIHSNSFPGAKEFENQRVLVIGGSFTGLQLVSQILYGTQTAEVFHVVQRRRWILPRYLTIDARDPKAYKICDPNERYDFPTVQLPLPLVSWRRCNRGPLATSPVESRVRDENASRMLNLHFSEICHVQNKSKDWAIDPNSKDYYNPAVAGEFLEFLQDKNPEYNNRYHLLMDDEIEEFTESGVIMRSGTSVKNIHSVISCTGYKLEYEYFDPEIKEKLEFEHRFSHSLSIILYRGTFRQEIPNLAFIENPNYVTGFYRELQARYASYVFSSRLPHPDIRNPMVSQYMEEERSMRTLDHFDGFRAHFDHIGYSDALANDIGALPDFEKLRTEDPELHNMLVYGPFHQDHYNLQGFGTDPAAARRSIEETTRFIEERARVEREKFNLKSSSI